MNINNMTIYDVVMNLIGPIDPVGETYQDGRRLENLGALISLTDSLITVIKTVRDENEHYTEYSIKRAANLCEEWLTGLGMIREQEEGK